MAVDFGNKTSHTVIQDRKMKLFVEHLRWVWHDAMARLVVEQRSTKISPKAKAEELKIICRLLHLQLFGRPSKH